ncbi:MAG TPA: AAA family ATPase [Candidatus Dormibacteraeota bacterium]
MESLPLFGYDGYIFRGGSHLLAGWWRLGKTELMAAAILPWLRKGLSVTWVTEEASSIWADRSYAFDDIYEHIPWDRLRLIDALSAPPNELLDAVKADDGWDVLVGDTLQEVCGVTSMKDDDAVRAGVGPWLRALRDDRRTLIFLAQHRKQEGDSGHRVMGSVALPAMFDNVLELQAVDGHERQRRLSVRRRREQTPPLLLEMDEQDRIKVVPDGRQRSRVDAEQSALAIVTAATNAMTTAEVRQQMAPAPSRDTVSRALLSLARAGSILRDPPIGEDAERKTVSWLPLKQLDLPQNSYPLSGEFAAADDVAADSASEATY